MTTAQFAETSVTVNNSPIQDYVNPDDRTQPTFEITPSLQVWVTSCGKGCRDNSLRVY